MKRRSGRKHNRGMRLTAICLGITMTLTTFDAFVHWGQIGAFIIVNVFLSMLVLHFRVLVLHHRYWADHYGEHADAIVAELKRRAAGMHLN